MYTVLEIGCGSMPGPRLETADRHVGIDINPVVLREAHQRSTDISYVQADLRTLPFSDESVDVVLARNVLGDPELCLDEAERGRLHSLQHAAIAAGRAEELGAISNAATREVSKRKQEVLEEVGRVLVSGGKFVVVEQYTPFIAREFIEHLPATGRLSRLASIPLGLATSPGYAAYQTSREPHTHCWQATKF